MANIRIKRINSEIQRNLSEILSKLKNPAITAMISVTRVETTADLKHCKIWLSFYGAKEQCDSTYQVVLRSSGYIRRELASLMKDIRVMPELHFLYDDSLEYSQKINKLIEQINTGKNDDQS
ncbi:MAG: 30S ribosome-binding factor RbfA [Clostridiales bacterium]|jgi:ribosome-binding factor A|nr:30S ribosome-binding factor RbfA [Clostridiales bacterium]